MKRLLRCLLEIALIFSAACFIPPVGVMTGNVKASAGYSENYSYLEYDDGTVYIDSYWGDNSVSSITIPSTLNGKTVVGIKGNVFSSVTSTLKSVKIPNTVKYIYSDAFKNLTNLEKVELSSNLVSIGSSAFSGCTKLASVTLPNTLKTIDDYAFYKCSSLKSIALPSSLTKLGNFALQDCTSLSDVTIPSTLNDFGGRAFEGTPWLTARRKVYSDKLVIVNQILIDGSQTTYETITLPNGLEGIGNLALNGNNKIKNVVIPNTVKSIGVAAFAFSDSIENINIPSSITHFGGNAFDDTKWLADQQKKNPIVVLNGILVNGDACTGAVTIPSTVKKIGEWAFYQNKKITSVSIPSSVTSMEEKAFNECTALKSVSIANGLTNFSYQSFMGCSALESINIPSTVKNIAEQAFSSCKALKSVSIPSSVTEIGPSAFYSCSALTSLVLPDSAVKINTYAFSYCGSIKSLTIPAKVQLVGSAHFTTLDSLTSLTIQEGRTVIPDSCFAFCKGLTELNLPDSIKVISDYAFAEAPLSSVLKLPKNLEKIGYCAFSRSDNVKTICIYDKLKEIDSDAISPITSSKTIKCFKDTLGDKFAKSKGANIIYFTFSSDRIAGANRYDTAAKIATQQFPKTTNNVVIASGSSYADALAGVPLATALNAPILLSETNELPQVTINKIVSLKAKKAYALGGYAAVSLFAENQLKALGLTVERLPGKDRYETAVNIAKALAKVTGKDPYSVFVVYSGNFPDAISAGPAAAALGAPILYIAGNGVFDTTTANYLDSVKSGLKKSYIIGGYGTIAEQANTQLSKYSSLVARLSGANRYSTCVVVNNYFKSTLNSEHIFVATGNDYPDALCAGVMAALTKSPVFLADTSLNSDQTSFLAKRNTTHAYIIGGKGAVSDDMVAKVDKAVRAGW